MPVPILIEPLIGRRFEIWYADPNDEIVIVQGHPLYFWGHIADGGTNLTLKSVEFAIDGDKDARDLLFRRIGKIVDLSDNTEITPLDWFNLFDVMNSDQINDWITEVKAGDRYD